MGQARAWMAVGEAKPAALFDRMVLEKASPPAVENGLISAIGLPCLLPLAALVAPALAFISRSLAALYFALALLTALSAPVP